MQKRRHALYGLAAFLSLMAIAIFTIWRFPPEVYHFYPACPIHEYLKIECPGCGTTRAISALLHGHFAEAVRFNALSVLLVIPFGTIYSVLLLRRSLNGGPFRWLAIPNPVVIFAIVMAAGFTILRNL